MPIWLRKFTFLKLKEHYDKESERNEKLYKQRQSESKHKIARPDISSTYNTKASK